MHYYSNIINKLSSTSSVSPTSSSPSSTAWPTLSFSTGGGGGTSTLDGATTPTFVSPASSSPASGLFDDGKSGTVGGDGEEVGGNLKFLSMVPGLLLRLASFSALAVLLTFGSASCTSPSNSSGVGSNP